MSTHIEFQSAEFPASPDGEHIVNPGRYGADPDLVVANDPESAL